MLHQDAQLAPGTFGYYRRRRGCWAESGAISGMQLHDHGVIAVVRLDDLTAAVDVTRALVDGGVTAVEFTFTNPRAGDAIAATRAALGGTAAIGAGSVLDSETARIAILAGAEYIVTPTFKRETVQTCNRYGVPSVIGAFTATEMLTAQEAGASYIKMHPASLGGPKYFRDVLAPLPFLKLIPSGGVSVENAAEFIRAGAVAVAMGGNLVDAGSVARKDWAVITERARVVSAVVKAAIAERSA
jgi:2-dehydro-3-deoxyphosphogluconate aldolase/(4S)-4-hydroxy-2-oxoglutarate aldolase